jgi:fumarate hydratase class II
MSDYRTEKDSLGEVSVPADALYGAQTQRAVENFPISGIRFPRVFIRTLGLVKCAAAEVNAGLGLLEKETGSAIRQAAQEVAEGAWDRHFPVDIFQTGSGTSTNMNANEVIARRATLILGDDRAAGTVHPNDHVNLGQSSNDIMPAAIHISACLLLSELLLPALLHLEEVLSRRSGECSGIVKTGRTHLMDAMPITLGQELGGWAYQVRQGRARIESCLPRLLRLAIGGTAVGTGINTHPEFGRRMAGKISEMTGLSFVETDNHFAAQAAMDSAMELSGHLKTMASALMKIANDLRLMNSGPLSGLAEITLPALQPGSSIMPGKVNPVICEAVIMVCAQVTGNDMSIALGNSLGNFELNTMLPLIAHNLMQSITIMGNAARVFADKAVDGFWVNEKRIAEALEKNPILATRLVPVIGYDRAAEIVKQAHRQGRRIRDVAREMTDLSEEELDRLLDPKEMI